MIIELDTLLLNAAENINMNQLVFLSMVLDKNQKSYNQDVQKLVSLITDDEISYLIEQGLITSIERRGSTVYEPTEKLSKIITPEKDFSTCSMTCTQFMYLDQMVQKAILGLM